MSLKARVVASWQRKHGLRSVAGLNLRLFVDRQLHRLRGWIEIQANDVLDFLRESGIVADLERAQAMRLQISCLSRLSNLVHGHIRVFRHQPQAPKQILETKVRKSLGNHRGRESDSAKQLRRLDPLVARQESCYTLL